MAVGDEGVGQPRLRRGGVLQVVVQEATVPSEATWIRGTKACVPGTGRSESRASRTPKWRDTGRVRTVGHMFR